MSEQRLQKPSPEISITTRRSERGLTLLMAVACGLTVANLYYCQPLLTQIGASLSAERAGAYIPTFTQVGAMFGMGLFVPLGDILERRRLIVSVCCALAAMLLASSAAPNFLWLAIASVCLGLTCIVPHLILPFAAQIAPPQHRGRVLGTVLSGLLMVFFALERSADFLELLSVGVLYTFLAPGSCLCSRQFCTRYFLKVIRPSSSPIRSFWGRLSL